MKKEKGDFCILEIEDIVHICNMKIHVLYTKYK